MKYLNQHTKQSDSGSAASKANGGGAVLSSVPALQQKETEEPIKKFSVQQKTTTQFASGADDKKSLKPFQLKSNNTGLPDNLKSGVENLSGMSMDHVKVHYNSSQPAQLNALAYAQGSDIHVGPGQEKHLPHEAWHVVQQAQGRVQATTQMKVGAAVNDDPGLEHEADVMGEKAMNAGNNLVIQQKTDVKQVIEDGTDTTTSSKEINTPTLGQAWFKFAKNGEAINSFSNNIYSGVGTKGGAPVTNTVEIGAQHESEGGSKEEVAGMTRAKHFGLGDRAIGKSKDDRKGKRTWHHQDGKYYMELVDMHVHGGFGHTGGFSQWQEDHNDED